MKRILCLGLLFPMLFATISMGCMSRKTKVLKLPAASVGLDTVHVLPVEILDETKAPEKGKKSRHPTGRLEMTPVEYEKALVDALVASGSVERVIEQEEGERFEAAGSPVSLRFQVTRNQIQWKRYNGVLAPEIIFSIITICLLLPALRAMPAYNYEAQAEGSLRLVNIATGATLMKEDVEVVVKRSGNYYNGYKKVLPWMKDRIAHNLTVEATRALQKSLASDPALAEKVAGLSKTGYSQPVRLTEATGAPDVTPDPEAKGLFAAPSSRWAVVIGVSEYSDPRIPALQYAADDALSFYEWIIAPDGGGYAPDRVRLLLNQDATCNNMRVILFEWLKRAIDEDMVTIYFAGHGSPESPDNPENLFLLPYDTDWDTIATTGFPMWDIETALKRYIKAKKVVVVSDACHSGGVGESFDIARRASEEDVTPNAINSALNSLSNIGNGICVISASNESQYSQEGEQWGGGHGVFTHFLLQGLSGAADFNQDRRVSLGEIIPYLSEEVRRETKNAQSPNVAGRYDPALSIAR